MMIQYLFLYTSKYCNGERNNSVYGVFMLGHGFMVLSVVELNLVVIKFIK